MGTRLHIVVSEDLLARVDAARGVGQPRSDWVRRAVEQALADDAQAGALRGVEGHRTRVSPSPTGAASVRGASEPSAPAEQPVREWSSDEEHKAVYREPLRDLVRPAREFRPYPKGGR